MDEQMTWDDWKSLIYTDGKLDEEKVKNELMDYGFLLEQVPKVYDAVTGGKLSKTNYHAQTIIAGYKEQFDDYVHKDDIRDALESLIK